ncbi:(2Fe-2S)-binding protein [Halobacterium litoreum]|uniref:(2Fe-2S)-binding protein n=1 Tax=Halobacterium litoreum TaxID=2039234 RepID=A0ABD5NBX7_9EURY|nr:(2Fe-2S)-binding protein [Halobacterium litoreum]UHH14327.1 (2Fe-2S)-binding protein [Halobacterium litoreum]
MSSESSSQSLDRPTEDVTLSVNGETVSATVEPRLKLSDFLRQECGQRGVRVGCEHGVCGACTVLVDGKATKSCLTYAVQVDDAEVTTVEGLSDGGDLHPIQEAFHQEHALQCGFCTSGFVMATKELLDREPDPDQEQIEEGLADNICRCTGYVNIYSAVDRAAEELAEVPSDDLTDRTAGGDD